MTFSWLHLLPLGMVALRAGTVQVGGGKSPGTVAWGREGARGLALPLG